MAFNLTRMTAYALVSAIEQDLRSLIKNHLNPEGDNIRLNPDLVLRAKIRIEKDIGVIFDNLAVGDLVDYFDLGDTFQTINSNKAQFPEHLSKKITSYTRVFDKVIPIRNRVMHIRPMDFQDLPTLTSFCETLLEDPDTWQNVYATLEKLKKEPSFVLGLEIKTLDDDTGVSHNLPLPDFDETGLIGRDDEVAQVKRLCLGNFPVISIVGEGGVGKTALALKVAYELLEDEKQTFDAIIWVTSKTSQITVNEIKEIKGAISNSLGVFQSISDQLIGQSGSLNFDEITDYLATFRIALFIDNLETILDDNIRNFVGSLPPGSKIIITSRIGLGAFEYPIKLRGITESHASQLLRTTARLRGVESLAKLDEKVLRAYVSRMHCNPSYIKWFVSSVQTGRAPEVVLQNSAMFLEFCMSNVYEFLTPNARQLTAAFQCAPGLRDIPELNYLTDLGSLEIQRTIQELMSTNMLSEATKSKGASVKTSYQLSELARAYLGKHHRPSQSFQKAIREKLNKLSSLYEQQMSQRVNNRYSINSIRFRDKNDRVVAKMLSEALRYIYAGQHDQAYEVLQEAHRLSPDYSEVARVMAYFYQKSGNLSDAREQYELATVLEPDSSQLYYWYGKFLLHEEENADDAVEKFEKAFELDKKSSEICLSLARGYMFQHRFNESRAVLESLKDKLPDLDEQRLKMYVDTDIQIHYRTADDLTSSGNYSEAIENFEKMKDTFQALSENLKDHYLRSKLSKCLVSLAKINKHGTQDQAADALRLTQWVNSEAKARR